MTAPERLRKPPSVAGERLSPGPTGVVQDAILRVFLPGRAADARLAPLDTVRAAAVFSVFIHHTWFVAGSPVLPASLPLAGRFSVGALLQGAGYGVDIFFVLSGFLLAMPWHRAAALGAPRPSLRRYFTRRLLRIVPPYWFLLLMMLLTMTNSTIPWDAAGGPDGVRSILAHLVFAQYLFPATAGGFAGVNGSLWTLTIEMLFYLTLPILALAFVKTRWRVALPVSIAVSVAFAYLARTSLSPVVGHLQHEVARFAVSTSKIRYFLGTQYPAFVGEFAIGIATSGWWIRRTQRERTAGHSSQNQARFGLLALAGAAVAVAAMYEAGRRGFEPGYFATLRMTVAASVGAVIVGVIAGPASLIRRMSFLPSRLYGIIGYSVFLWHLPLLTVMGAWPIFRVHDPALRFLKLLAVATPLVTLVGVVLYLLVERPFLTHRPTLAKSPVPEPAASS